jgi:photosystem II stability/assembly factor-like uncharacterized protein
MVSDLRGFAVGDGVIVATSDGRSWVEQHRGPEEFVYVSAVDGDHAWAVARSELLRTVDGGRHWFQFDQPDGALLQSVHFVSPTSGWGVGNGKLFRTADGGRTWDRLKTPCGAEAVCFTDGEHGWVAAGQRVDRSQDGGDTWVASFQVPASGPSHALYVRELQCAAPGAVWASFTGTDTTSGNRPYVVFRGSTTGDWRAVAAEALTGPEGVDAPAAGSHPPRLSALGPEEAVLLTFTPQKDPPVGLVLAIGGGRQLDGAQRPVTVLSSRAAASFLSPAVGWVVGGHVDVPERGVIISTRDGGLSWQEQYSYEP